MAALHDLLAVQELDTRLDQLRHRRANLPVQEQIDALASRLAEAESARGLVADRLHQIRAEQKEAEDHAALLEDKAVSVNTSMFDGSVVAHKELEALQEELGLLKQRQSDFEDRALELMEAAEPVEAELARHDEEIGGLSAQRSQLDQQVTVEQAEIGVEIDRLTAERELASASVPPQLLSAYEPLRASLGGVAVARLHGARCEGCHLEIPSAELEEVRRAPADELAYCPECMRILVR